MVYFQQDVKMDGKYSNNLERYDTSQTQKKYYSKKSLKSINEMTRAELVEEHKRINKKIDKYASMKDDENFPLMTLCLACGALVAAPIGFLGAFVIDNFCGTKLGASWALIGLAVPPAIGICRKTYAKIAMSYYENKDKKIDELHKQLSGKSIRHFETEQMLGWLT